MAQVIIGCTTPNTTLAEMATEQHLSTPVPAVVIPPQAIVESPDPAYMNAQATIVAGKGQLLDLSRKETETGLNQALATDAAVQSTQDYNQRQKIDLNYQATIVSLNITQAAATQEFLSEQTKVAQEATRAAQRSSATAAQSIFLMNLNQTEQAHAILDALVQQTAQAEATLTAYSSTATYSAYLFNVTGTVQARAILSDQATQTAQVIVALTAYPETATPYAVTQAALLMQEYGREQKTFFDQIVAPLIPIFLILDLLGISLVIALVYRRSISYPLPRRLSLAPGDDYPEHLVMIDGVMTDPVDFVSPAAPVEVEQTQAYSANPPIENSVHVEIVNASEPPVAHWIADVERQMKMEGVV